MIWWLILRYLVCYITIFKDIKVTSQPFYRGAVVILNRIKEGSSKDLVKRIREEKDKLSGKGPRLHEQNETVHYSS